MTVLVCGSRSWTDQAAIARRLAWLPPDSTVVHGGAGGADSLADAVARQLGLRVVVVRPDWSRGRRAGPERNVRMLEEHRPDLVIAFWKDGSRGTGHTISQALTRGIETHVVEWDIVGRYGSGAFTAYRPRRPS